jgi:hypothetical protein
MRHTSLLHALTTAGLFTGLFLGSSLISDASAATADHALAVSARALILHIKLSDRGTGVRRSAARGVTGRHADRDHRHRS